MDWIALSLLSAVSFTAYSIIQKRALMKQTSGVFAFGFWGAMLHLVLAMAILIASPLTVSWTSTPALAMIAAGLLNVGFNLLVNRVVRQEDVTRIVPILDSYPVFIAIMAVLFLGESLTPVKWLAILLVVCGVLLASWHQALPGSRVRIGGPLVLLLISSFGIAVYSILAKYALGHISFWHAYAISSVASAPAFALAVQAFRAWPEVRLTARRSEALATVWSAHGMIFLAFMTGLWAFELGPVSLSSAVMATRPVMILAYVTLVAVLVPRGITERNSEQAALEKGGAAALVTLGIGAMAVL